METPTNETSWTSIFKNIWNKINPFKSKLNIDKKEDNTVEDNKGKEERDKILKRIIATSLDFPEDDNLLIATVNQHISLFKLLYEDLGVTDGKIVAKDFSIYSVTSNHSTRIVEQTCSKLQSRIAGLEDKITSKENIKLFNETNNRRWHEFNGKITDFYHNSHRHFSKNIARICILFGFLLIIADLPLSLALVGNFDIGTRPVGFLKQIKDPGLLLFALGIAFCTVYIKILYDEYINTNLGEWKLSFKSNLNNSESNENEGSLKTEFFIKLFVKLLILVALIVTLVFLGRFRNMYSGLGEPIRIKGLFTIEDIFFVRLMCFVGITLVIPTISGVCLSVGFAINNLRSIKKESEGKMKESQQALNEIVDEISSLKAVKSKLHYFFTEWNKTEHKIKTISDEFSDLYNQGYKRGYISVNGNDLFKQVRELYNNRIMVDLTKQSIKTPDNL